MHSTSFLVLMEIYYLLLAAILNDKCKFVILENLKWGEIKVENREILKLKKWRELKNHYWPSL